MTKTTSKTEGMLARLRVVTYAGEENYKSHGGGRKLARGSCPAGATAEGRVCLPPLSRQLHTSPSQANVEGTASVIFDRRPALTPTSCPASHNSASTLLLLNAFYQYRVKQSFGRLDVVAINSGYSGHVELLITDKDPAIFVQATQVNYVGIFRCAKYLIPLLLDSPNGAKDFIGVSSMASFILRGPIANARYCVSKLAQLKLLEHLHEQCSSRGVSIYAVHPGAVDSEMARETAPEAFKAYLTDSPNLCGAFCIWLKSNNADWLSGRLVSSTWDVDELMQKKDDILSRDLLKAHVSI